MAATITRRYTGRIRSGRHLPRSGPPPTRYVNAMQRLLCGALLLTLLLAAGMAGAEARRVALVIGNSAYSSVPELPNPAKDAIDLAAALDRLGFAVDLGLDLDANAMRSAIAAFRQNAVTADLSLVYYAGHGIEVDRTNYLIPVDATLAERGVLGDEALPLAEVIGALI